MTTKVVNFIKQGGFSLLIVIGLFSCEGPIEEVGVNIVDNDLFDSDKFVSDVRTYNQNILKREGNSLGQYLLGVHKNNDFGRIEATVLGQVAFNSTVDFGLDPTIDTIIVNIPYYSTEIGRFDDGSREFELDSIIGNQDIAFNLKVSELKTYLNTLDPENPSEVLAYYTDETYDVGATPFYEELFMPNALDTVLYVERSEVILDWETMEHDRDTIKNLNAAPSIKLALEEEYFTNNFLNNPAIFTSLDVFLEFFRGLYIEAESVVTDPMASDASLMTLNMGGSTMTIYYTNTILTDETITSTNADGVTTIVSETDLNGDGDTTDEDVEVRTKQSVIFSFGGVTNNKYTRDYSNSNAESVINSPDMVNGDSELFIQGAAGSVALVDLFYNDDIEELRSKNWLINNAILHFYIDQSADKSIVPDRVYLYNFDDDRHLTDVLTEGLSTFDGRLQRDPDGEPYRYSIKITDYISRVLASDDPLEISKLALKVFNNSDSPLSPLDVDVKDKSWNSKGIVIHGNQSIDLEKRVQLEISYTEINN